MADSPHLDPAAADPVVAVSGHVNVVHPVETVAIAPDRGTFATFTIVGGQPPMQILPYQERRHKAVIYLIGTPTEAVWIGSQAGLGGPQKAGAQLAAAAGNPMLEIWSKEQYWAAPTDTTGSNTATLVVVDYFYDGERVKAAGGE